MIKQHDPLIIVHEDLEIREALNGYYIYHTPSGAVHGMSDGVDVYQDEDEGTLSPGTTTFNQTLDHDLTENYVEFLEAYFPDVAYD